MNSHKEQRCHRGYSHHRKNCGEFKLQSLNLIDTEILSPKGTVQQKGKGGGGLSCRQNSLLARLWINVSDQSSLNVFGLFAELLDCTGRMLWWLQSHDLSCRLYLTFSRSLCLICIINLIHSIVISLSLVFALCFNSNCQICLSFMLSVMCYLWL